MLPVLTVDEAQGLVEGEWMRHGACTSPDAPDLLDITDEEMQQVCDTCPVQGHCLSYSMLVDARHFVYGGLTPAERKHLDNGQRYSICAAPDCGRGFLWTRVGNTQPPGVCDACNSTARLATSYSYGGRP